MHLKLTSLLHQNTLYKQTDDSFNQRCLRSVNRVYVATYCNVNRLALVDYNQSDRCVSGYCIWLTAVINQANQQNYLVALAYMKLSSIFHISTTASHILFIYLYFIFNNLCMRNLGFFPHIISCMTTCNVRSFCNIQLKFEVISLNFINLCT